MSRAPAALGPVLALAAAVGAGACTAPAAEVRPPDDQFYYPTGMATSPDESLLFVANANSDLRYDSGTLAVVDLDRVDQAVAPWVGGGALAPGCSQDPDYPEIMVCDEAAFLRPEAEVRTGSFATSVAVQDLGPGGDLRLLVPVRGDPSITWITWDAAAGALVCDGSGGGGLALCDDDHRLTDIRDDAAIGAIPNEPWDVFVDSGNEFALVSHLTSGSVSLVDSPKDGKPVVTDVVTGLFAANSVTGSVGATAVGGRTPGADGDIVYVASRTEDRVQTFTVARPQDSSPRLVVGNFFFLSSVGGQSGLSSDSRGIAFDQGGDRMFVLNRLPPSLQVYDTSLGPDGAPRNQVLGSTDVCRGGSKVTLADVGDGDRAYVACFANGQVYVVDPRDGVQVADVVTVGRGPYDVVAAPSRRELFVTNYLEDSIAVVDLTPGAATENRVVMRIGTPTAPGDEK